jgi:predicted PurR-regulated permease PerM
MLIEQFLPKAAVGVITSIPSLLLVPYLSFFFLKDGAKFKRLIMRGVPNAFFEKILLLFDQMDRQVRMYFRGLMGMTFLDTVTLGLGLWVIGLIFGDGLFPFGQAMTLGFICAVLSWVPVFGHLSRVSPHSCDYTGLPGNGAAPAGGHGPALHRCPHRG